MVHLNAELVIVFDDLEQVGRLAVVALLENHCPCVCVRARMFCVCTGVCVRSTISVVVTQLASDDSEIWVDLEGSSKELLS